MFPQMNDYPVGVRDVRIEHSAESTAAFLRKVYTYFTLSVVAAAAGAFASLYLGADTSRAMITLRDGASVAVPPLVSFFARHWIIGGLLFLGSVMGASFVRQRPGVNVMALLGMGFVSGLVAAPAIWFTQLMATTGQTLTTSPVRDAFLLAVTGFVGLTGYAMVSRRDFSFLRGFLSMGLWVVLGAMILGWFVQSSALSLAVASAGVLLFGGFILYDTWRIVHRPEERGDAVGVAISIYLSFLNLFLFLLSIFRGGSRDA